MLQKEKYKLDVVPEIQGFKWTLKWPKEFCGVLCR